MDFHANQLRWTFGNHEPLSMYRRIGRESTGGVCGNALWLEKWHHWYDSEDCVRKMAGLGFNILHCRFYKGMGWEIEKEDFPAVRHFAELCRKYGIKVLAYVQFSTLYPEMMRGEVPELADWAARDRNGNFLFYGSDYWRWMPCPNSEPFLAYTEKIIAIAAESKVFDGLMFDNLTTYACYCPTCRRKFRQYLKARNFPYVDPDFVEMPTQFSESFDPDNHPLPDAYNANIKDPVRQQFQFFLQDSMAGALNRLYRFAKSRAPEFIISANIPVHPRRQTYTRFFNPPEKFTRSIDLFVAQSGNEPEVTPEGCVVSQALEIKMAHALEKPILPLNDSDAGGVNDMTPRYIGALFESLFGNGIPVDRTVMKPMRGGAFNEACAARRGPVLLRLKEIAEKYRDLLDLPDYEPVGLLYSTDSFNWIQRAADSFLRAAESLLRGHVPFRVVIAEGESIGPSGWDSCETLIVPGANCLSDAVVRKLRDYSGSGRIVFGGECGNCDEFNRERDANPFADLDCGRVDITPHRIFSANWKNALVAQPDDWNTRFASALMFELDSRCHAVVKRDGDRIAAVLFSAPAEIPEGGLIRFRDARPGRRVVFVDLDGEKSSIPMERAAAVPSFRGMLMAIFEE